MLYYFFLEKSECVKLNQDVGLKAWDMTPGPTTDLPIVDVTSPDTSQTEGQRDPEVEETICEPLVCARHELPRCTIGRMNADMMQALIELEKIKEAATALQRRMHDYVDMLSKF
ncbi:hypothetical protein AB205_0084470 [Aquarana catesbeiana]|uniref:Uncharacterized protein n=1 Tax=Aquarana catesbeiana TaxID=8400 RepID=A0A2G9R6R6_AQUCT|nr:hypothetical protein AB205_0084470 [Aquarana catesbeiana]